MSAPVRLAASVATSLAALVMENPPVVSFRPLAFTEPVNVITPPEVLLSVTGASPPARASVPEIKPVMSDAAVVKLKVSALVPPERSCEKAVKPTLLSDPAFEPEIVHDSAAAIPIRVSTPPFPFTVSRLPKAIPVPLTEFTWVRLPAFAPVMIMESLPEVRIAAIVPVALVMVSMFENAIPEVVAEFSAVTLTVAAPPGRVMRSLPPKPSTEVMPV